MFKFLRRYNKLILAVGGTLLLIVFLIPQAIQSLSQRAATTGIVVATVGDGGEAVSAREWEQVQGEMLFMQRTGRQFFVQLEEITDPAHWYLLAREAEQAGLIGLSPLAVASEDQLVNVALQGGVNVAFAERALSRIFGVEHMLALYLNAGKLSDRRLLHESERLLHQVEASIVVIEADADASQAEFTEDQLQAQLDEFADMTAGSGERGFGYQMPNRAKLEWLAIPQESVREIIAADDQATRGIALRRHWRDHALTDGLPPVSTAADVPEAVRDHLINQLTQARLEEIAKWAADELQAPRRGYPQRAGYYELPEDWSERMLKFPDLAEKIRERYGIALPEYHAAGDRFYSMPELAELPGIGTATTDKFGTPRTLDALVGQAKEFGGSTSVFAQRDVAGPPMRGADGGIYFFRIIATDPARRPASLDEVRDQVVADLRRVDHYDRLAADIGRIEARGQTAGILSVAMDHDTIVHPPEVIALCNPYLISLGSFVSPLPVIGQNEQAVGRIIDHALALPRDRKIDELPLAQRVIAVAVPEKLAIVVVRLDRQLPLTRSTYEQLVSAAQLQTLLRLDELDGGQALKDAFSYDALAKRHNFVLNTRSDDETEDDGPGAETAKTASVAPN